jgi:hypothetical protein
MFVQRANVLDIEAIEMADDLSAPPRFGIGQVLLPGEFFMVWYPALYLNVTREQSRAGQGCPELVLNRYQSEFFLRTKTTTRDSHVDRFPRRKYG